MKITARVVAVATTTGLTTPTTPGRRLPLFHKLQPRGGLGPNVRTITNAEGGKQSAIPYRMDLIDADALLHVSQILAEGAAKYGEDNWRKISITDHINHAITHLYAALSGDTQDDHLGHAVCRTLFALAVGIEQHDYHQVESVEAQGEWVLSPKKEDE